MAIIKTYVNNSDRIIVDKNITLVDNIENASFIDNVDLYNPILILSKNIEPNSFNYVYVPMFNRYYYAEEPPKFDAGFYTIKLHCDVLMSFKNSFLNEEVVVDRSESNYNLYLPDEQIKLYGYQYYQIKKLNPMTSLHFNMNTEQFVLNCAGGV